MKRRQRKQPSRIECFGPCVNKTMQCVRLFERQDHLNRQLKWQEIPWLNLHLIINPIFGGFPKPPSWGGGGDSANLHHPHISWRKNAIFIIFGKNVHFHKYFKKTWRKFKKSDDVSRFWAKIRKIQSKSGKFRSKKQNPITSSNIVQFWCFTHKMKAKTLNFLQIMKKSRKYRNADLWSSGFDRW